MMFRSFIAKLILITAAIAAVLAMGNFLSPFLRSFQIFSWSALAFFFLLTVITGYMGFRAIDKSTHGFIASVNGIVLLKLVLSIGFLICFLLITKPAASTFIVSFFFLYITFTVFEIYQLVVAQKIKIKEQNPSQHVAR